MSTTTATTTATATATATAVVAPHWNLSVLLQEIKARAGPNGCAATDDQTDTIDIAQSDILVFVDQSGSTLGAILNAERTITFDLARATRGKTRVVMWSTFARDPVLSSAVPWRSDGGTDPSSTARNPTVVAALKSHRGLVVFITDGEIAQADVTKFASHIQLYAHLPVLAVVVASSDARYQNISQCNISVLAPFSACRDVVFAVTTPNNVAAATYRPMCVVHAKGVFASAHACAVDFEIDGRTTPQMLPALSLAHLVTKTPAFVIDRALPPGYINARGNMKLSPDRLFAAGAREPLTIDEFATVVEALPDIVLYCKTTSTLPALRRFLVAQNAAFKRADCDAEDIGGKVAPLLRRIHTLVKQQPPLHGEEIEIKFLRAAVLKLRASAEDRQQAACREHKTSVRDVCRAVQATLASITDVEKQGYDASVLARLSTRAMRAEKVFGDNDDDGDDGIRAWNLEGCLRGECAICADEQAVMALTILSVPDSEIERNTADSPLNWPLAYGHQDVILNDQLCMQCASMLERSPTTRQKVRVALPLVSLASPSNYARWRNRLALALACGLKVPSLFQLMFAVLDYTLTEKAWGRGDGDGDGDDNVMYRMLRYAYLQILDNATTNDALAETGQLVPLRRALQSVITVPERFEGYPMIGCALIMRTLIHENCDGRPLDNGCALMHRRFLIDVVATYLRSLYDDITKSTGVGASAGVYSLHRRIEIIRTLYKCEYGVPVQGTATLAALAARYTRLSMFPLISKPATHALFKYADAAAGFNIDHGALAVVLHGLLDVVQHDSLQACILKMRAASALVVQAFDSPRELDVDVVLHHLNKRYEIANASESTHFGTTTCAFATPFGPSVLKCHCGFSFLPPVSLSSPSLSPSLSHDALVSLAAKVTENRRAHFADTDVYDAQTEFGNPGNVPSVTMHFNLHASIRRCYARGAISKSNTLEANADAIVQEIVLRDKRGNIHSPGIRADIANVLPTYWRLNPPVETALNVPMVTKLRIELGMCAKKESYTPSTPQQWLNAAASPFWMNL